MTSRILILTTSHGTLGETGKPTGFHWQELTDPYWAFRDAGDTVEIASVHGGQPPADPGSDDGEGERPRSVQRFMDDESAMRALTHSLPVSELKPRSYDAVYLPGGHGTMWDLPDSKAVAGLIGKAWEAGAIIAAVCHGPAGLVGATLADGTPLVKGRRVNSFTDAEERKAGLDEVVPFLLESRLRELGAVFEGNDEAFGPHVARDGRLITGQNPASSKPLADQVLAALKNRQSEPA
ncbi:MAG: glutamine amidotransferase [Oceanicaulis sp.]|nr:glutamine amidotransferase [Oceanicaulis sp.]MAZ92755.1 glutamine amidotransferase [Maricaulis sp.]MBI75335.1 glutamine amidotransferase [Oceanicaulis sp.]